MKYQIELTKKQLSVIQEALEFYSRFSAGQVTVLPPHLVGFLFEKHGKYFGESRDAWEKHLNKAKEIMFHLSSNASIGIGNEELIEEAKIAYDIYRPILELFAKDWNDDHTSAYAYPGLSYSKEGRITIKEK